MPWRHIILVAVCHNSVPPIAAAGPRRALGWAHRPRCWYVMKLGDLGVIVKDGEKSKGWTPIYAPPEQMNYEPITTLTDIHAMAVLLVEMSSGEFLPDEYKFCMIDWTKRSEFIQYWKNQFPLVDALNGKRWRRPQALVFREGPPS